jgi:hypothetical protein
MTVALVQIVRPGCPPDCNADDMAIMHRDAQKLFPTTNPQKRRKRGAGLIECAMMNLLLRNN